MVDLMMWLVIAAMLLAAAIQAIGYYQQAAYAYQAQNDVTHGHEWAAARVSLESKSPDSDSMADAITAGNFKISNRPDIALVAATGNKYCIGVKAYNVNGDNVFYSTSDNPARIMRVKEMPASCGTVGEAPGPDAPAKDTDGDSIPNTIDEDIDNDGILNQNDPDVDGDGIPNASDPDIDGDRIPNAKDDTPNGVIVGPKFVNAAGGPASIDPRVTIVGATMAGNAVNVAVHIDNVGLPTNTGPYYGLSWRVTCQVPDGTQYYKYGSVWTSYTGATASEVSFNFPCPTFDSSKAVGYIAGTYNGVPELKEPTSGTKGPVNVISEGVLSPLTGNTVGTATQSSFVDPLFSLRNAVLSPSSLVVGTAFDLGGRPSNVNPYFGISARLTCKLADGSTFYHYPTLQSSYNGASYPAYNHTVNCPVASTSVGYVVGGDGGSPELAGISGSKGPLNVLRGGQVDLIGNDASIAPAPAGSYTDPRLTVRKVTLTGGTDIQVGLSINMAGVTSPGASYGISARVTCQNTTTGVNYYKTAGFSTSYTSGSYPAPTYTVSCAAGLKAVGYIVGPYLGTPELTYNPGVRAPSNVVIGGVQ